MSQLDKLASDVTSFGLENGKIQVLHVAAGGATALFSVLALDVVAAGVITTYYYWPMTDGHLRYGSTAPTIATQDTAGAEVNH